MSAKPQPPRPHTLITDAQRLQHLRWMILARTVDDRMCSLKKQDMIAGSVFTGRGQEAFAAAGGMCLRPGDVYAPLIRDLAGRLAFGEPVIDGVRTCLGRRTGPMRGRDGNIHRGSFERGHLPMISHLGAMISVVCGVLLARRLKGQLTGTDLPVGLTCIGDGGMNTGALHEGLNAAAVEKLPLVLLVANNQVAYSTFNDRTFACRDLVDRALGYGIRGHSCDGTDADACLATVHDAVARARLGEGPQMVVATLLRLAGHGLHDDASYVTEELKSRFGDCLPLAEKTLKVQGVASESAISAFWEEARRQVDAAVELARNEPGPDPAQEDWTSYSTRDLTQGRPMSISYLEAIRMALGDALEADPRVFIYGQDCGGAFGGAFKATKGLGERYKERVLNSPISEDAMAGIAIGAAIEGMRPVIEYQFSDFATIAFNQFVNHAGAYFWRNGHPCPLVARLPVGGTPGGGPYHCQMPEGWLTHHPGLVVVAPATVADAYFMLRDAIACDDPVMFCEHKYLYYHVKADFDRNRTEHLPLGAAAVRRAGTDCTLISWSGMVRRCQLAAEILAQDYDVDCELIDLRCVRPLDTRTILASVAKTGRVVIVTESFPFGGVAAEVQAMIASEAFQHLDAPPKRLCAQDTPIPFHPDLFVAHHPSEDRIVEAVLETLSF